MRRRKYCISTKISMINSLIFYICVTSNRRLNIGIFNIYENKIGGRFIKYILN